MKRPQVCPCCGLELVKVWRQREQHSSRRGIIITHTASAWACLKCEVIVRLHRMPASEAYRWATTKLERKPPRDWDQDEEKAPPVT